MLNTRKKTLAIPTTLNVKLKFIPKATFLCMFQLSFITFNKSRGWVQHAAPADASPPKYHFATFGSFFMPMESPTKKTDLSVHLFCKRKFQWKVKSNSCVKIMQVWTLKCGDYFVRCKVDSNQICVYCFSSMFILNWTTLYDLFNSPSFRQVAMEFHRSYERWAPEVTSGWPRD